MPVVAQQRHILAATTAFPAVPLNIHDGNAKTTWAVSLDGSGSAAYAVQFTLDPVMEGDVSAVWFDSVSGQTSSNQGNITVPITGVRLNMTTVSASSNATFRVVQSGT